MQEIRNILSALKRILDLNIIALVTIMGIKTFMTMIWRVKSVKSNGDMVPLLEMMKKMCLKWEYDVTDPPFIY